jgi:hypothetical protein
MALSEPSDEDRQMMNGMRRAAVPAALAGIALLAGACGGGSHPANATGGSGQLTARSVDVYAACIRSHGVPGFYFSRAGNSNSNPNGLTIQLGPWTAQDPNSPQFQTASKACNHLFPGGAPAPVTQQQKERLLQFAACMRVHGYPSYPDPQFPASGGIMQQQPPGVDLNSPHFQAAMKTCNAKS